MKALAKAKALDKSLPQSYKSYQPNKLSNSQKVQAQGFVSASGASQIIARTDCGTWSISFDRTAFEEFVRLHGHICLIVEGTGVTFDLLNRTISNVRFDIQPILDQYEISFIRSWDNKLGRGMAARECGCPIFIHYRNVVPGYLADLRSGIFITHTVRSVHGHHIAAGDIAIYEPEVIPEVKDSLKTLNILGDL